ncbi:hypothetical protein GWK47_038402 [Chionoecetes opilio]|uniref:Uncharacterized protein n=1 Tax=Chionoecetes opilio TaxID=41210 RepID=A0A8J5CM55_CHIOP|nr:hypothetical protein GWK47_038402 [Chionoecetes opilio]
MIIRGAMAKTLPSQDKKRALGEVAESVRGSSAGWNTSELLLNCGMLQHGSTLQWHTPFCCCNITLRCTLTSLLIHPLPLLHHLRLLHHLPLLKQSPLLPATKTLQVHGNEVVRQE